ncbi:MAG: phosphonate C-P lyase system protein PhnH [Firmicutes bacterium]|nr:phosphonate C-P lyase system protein PhnH [Bacillota bacterium]
MKLDMVHDIQRTYRKVLNSMSRPGEIENIKNESQKVDIDTEFFNSTLVLMFMLLDAEVSFKIISNKEDEMTKFINQLTYAKSKELHEADFIFLLNDAKKEDIESTFKKAKVGDLINPNKSATIIVESEKITNEKDLTLKGPGIKEVNYVEVKLKGNWIEERNEKNIEYPLGIDVIFTDINSNIMCLPRTTQIFK